MNYNLLTMIKNKRDFDLYETIKNLELNQYKRDYKLLNSMEPTIIIRTKESDYQNNIKVERNETAQESLGKDVGEGIVQRYIRSKGRNRELDK